MKVTALYVYPIKALRGIPLKRASLTAHGIRHDRRFMLFEARDGNILKKIQIDSHTQCGLFAQEFASIAAPGESESGGAGNSNAEGEADAVVIRYLTPKTPVAPPHPLQATPLTVPLAPDIQALERVDVDLHKSPASVAYRMGGEYDAWFSACFGCDVMLIYLGDGHREVLGETLIPPSLKDPQPQQPEAQQGWPGWVAGLGAAIIGRSAATEPRKGPGLRPTIAFSDVAPFLVVSEASVRDVSARLPSGVDMDVRKFRPNIVVDGEEAWAEDFWGDVQITTTNVTEGSKTRLVLTANCARCVSLNVDYETGRPATGELGAVLKTLMKDRRVDKGSKWSPIFGRYGFLDGDDNDSEIRVGDGVRVTRRLEERTTWDWDIP